MSEEDPELVAKAEAAIRQVIDAFYDRARQDAVLGPLFNSVVEDWDRHLERITNFWSSAMLRTGRYDGGLMGAHFKHQALIAPHMFDRWLQLWNETTSELLPEGGAEAMQARARMIGDSMRMALMQHGRPWTPPQD